MRDKRLECAGKDGDGQMGAVAVEGDNALPARPREVGEHRRQAGRKTFALLRHDDCYTSGHFSQSFDVGRWTHDGNLYGR